MKINGKAMTFCIIATLFRVAVSAQTPMFIKNAGLLYPFFEKLARLDAGKGGKVNIVHIGDSHIQADYFTDAARRPLQQRFGDGGRGFIFPYNRNKPTVRPYRFTTNADWLTCRNNQPSKCEPGTEFGLSGYGFATKTERFALLVETSEPRYDFNTIKVVSPTAESYLLATVDGNDRPIVYNEKHSVRIHTVKSGETLDTIAKIYNVSATVIKNENRLRSNGVRAGRNLRIPVTEAESSVDMSVFRPVEYCRQEPFVVSYHRAAPMSAIYVLNAGTQGIYSMNGLIVERDAPGVIYHNIGTIGSMADHFNATPLFFEQLPTLNPDLVVISFGTNESFGELSVEQFMGSMELLVDNIRMYCRNARILVTTPPASLLRDKIPNIYIAEYTDALLHKVDVAVWDLYGFTGGLADAEGPFNAQKITRDYVHYTVEGYIEQGSAFADALLEEYNRYKRKNK